MYNFILMLSAFDRQRRHTEKDRQRENEHGDVISYAEI